VGRDDVVVEGMQMLQRIGVGLGVDVWWVGKGADGILERSGDSFVVVM